MREGNTHSPQQGGIPLDLRAVISARIIILLAGLCGTIAQSWLDESGNFARVQFLYVPIALLLILSVASLLYLKRRSAGAFFTHLQLIGDMLIVTGAVYVTGGPTSPFLFLYLGPVMASATLYSRNTALTVGAAGLSAYALLLTALYRGWFDPAAIDDVLPPLSGALLQLIGVGSAICLVAVLTSFLAGRLRSSAQIIATSERAIYDLSQRQKLLVEGMHDGVITTNLDLMITSINPAAEALLAIRQSQAVGRRLPDLLHDLAARVNPQSKEQIEITDLGEIQVPGENGEGVRTITYRTQPVYSSDGVTSGLIATLQDVTRLRSVEDALALHERMARMLSEINLDDSITGVTHEHFVGESVVMKKVFKLIDRVASSDATVLIFGESGTGKELVARALHFGSDRASKPFVPVNCGAIPENLIESELFGHKKGSFTGADSDHIGLFRQASGGTIFLDEIGELPLQMQAKLLRAIQQKSVRPVGGEKDISIDVRIVAATNRNLKEAIVKGGFREDLFYRLNVINVNLPPLRDRKEDLPLLISALLKRLVHDDAAPVIPPATMELLQTYDYPGNVRELENILERALVLGGEVILPEHLPEHVRSPIKLHAAPQRETAIIIDESVELPIKLDDLLAHIERRYLESALAQTNGAKKRAAELLGMNFRSFRYRLQKFGIDQGDEA